MLRSLRAHPKWTQPAINPRAQAGNAPPYLLLLLCLLVIAIFVVQIVILSSNVAYLLYYTIYSTATQVIRHLQSEGQHMHFAILALTLSC